MAAALFELNIDIKKMISAHRTIISIKTAAGLCMPKNNINQSRFKTSCKPNKWTAETVDPSEISSSLIYWQLYSRFRSSGRLNGHVGKPVAKSGTPVFKNAPKVRLNYKSVNDRTAPDPITYSIFNNRTLTDAAEMVFVNPVPKRASNLLIYKKVWRIPNLYAASPSQRNAMQTESIVNLSPLLHHDRRWGDDEKA